MARKLVVHEEYDVDGCAQCVYCVPDVIIYCFHPDVHFKSIQINDLLSIHPDCPLDELDFESEIE